MAFTFFLRDQQVLERVVEHFLPIVAGRSHPRIWDADVESTGQFAQIIAAGVYEKQELSRLPQGILDKYFEPDEKTGYFRVIDSIRRRVAFQRHDLLSFKEIGQEYSLVLCKNMLLHFQPPERIEVLRMFHRALAPGGLLATEHTGSTACCTMETRSKWATSISRLSTRPVTAATRSAFTTRQRAYSSLATPPY